jgi:hypothetical protein
LTSPLIASAAPPPWAGVWMAEDIEQIVHGVQNGSGIDGTLGGISAGLDALAFMSDPIGGLLQYGIVWLIEHVQPLSEALDWLAGDPAQIAAHAQTWRTWRPACVVTRRRSAGSSAGIRPNGAGALRRFIALMPIGGCDRCWRWDGPPTAWR